MAAVAATNTTGNIIPGSLPAELFLPVIFQKNKEIGSSLSSTTYVLLY
jgi:hypothetical protein